VGPEHTQALIFHEWATIETTVLDKGCVEARGELWGEKLFSINHLWTYLQSCGHMKIIAQGHIMKRSQHSLDRNQEVPFSLGDWSSSVVT
jgi:hypothetical protein